MVVHMPQSLATRALHADHAYTTNEVGPAISTTTTFRQKLGEDESNWDPYDPAFHIYSVSRPVLHSSWLWWTGTRELRGGAPLSTLGCPSFVPSLETLGASRLEPTSDAYLLSPQRESRPVVTRVEKVLESVLGGPTALFPSGIAAAFTALHHCRPDVIAITEG